MPLFTVKTLTGEFVYEAEDEEQARRLGSDGGRVILGIEEIVGGNASDADVRTDDYRDVTPTESDAMTEREDSPTVAPTDADGNAIGGGPRLQRAADFSAGADVPKVETRDADSGEVIEQWTPVDSPPRDAP